MKNKSLKVHKIVFVALLVVVFILGLLNFAQARGWLIPAQSDIEVDNQVIYLSQLSLEQKIAQMVIVHGGTWNIEPWQRMQLGGIHLFAMENAQVYVETISKFQQGMEIPFLVTVDLEGCWNPFANFKNFTALSQINSSSQAAAVGAEEGKFLKELGFSVDFSPVVDLQDEIWGCRSFPGNETEISSLASAYMQGMAQAGVLPTAKHFPGKTLVVKDPHKYIVAADISAQDVYPFFALSNVNSSADESKAVMVSHIISSGAIDSGGIPAVASIAAISKLKSNFSGLIISDEINMLGLKSYYATMDDLYVAVFASGNDLILNFNEDPNEIYHMIQVIKEAVEQGKIPQSQIDASVKKILELKGFVVEE